MARVFLFVLDSFGVGGAPDATRFGDEGADTFGHIAAACALGRGDRAGLRTGPLRVPNMLALGLAHAAHAATGRWPTGVACETAEAGFFGAASELSNGKDTPSGHWEIAGVPVSFEWTHFPREVPAFPPELTTAVVAEAGLPGILGDCHASGTEIIDRLGTQHIRTGMPICYTSADSVFQIAAHEAHFGLERLHDLCRIVRRLTASLNVGRVIARPFVGEQPGSFRRTANRRDYALPPPEPTLLDRLVDRGSRVFGIGKISDIFAHRGVSDPRKADGNMAHFDIALGAMNEAEAGDLVFVNLVDFDSIFGHRRDVPGYADALEAFDRRLPEALARLRPGDLLVLTADHGCDPTWRGTDHTRERVPILGTGPGLTAGPIGLRASYADIGATLADHLGLEPARHGTSFHPMLTGHA